jgi:hypothetical protein
VFESLAASTRTGLAFQSRLAMFARIFCLSVIILTLPIRIQAEKEGSHPDHSYDFVTQTAGDFPLSYVYGSIVEKSLIHDGRGKYATNITFQPRYASELFTKSVLFCGNHADAFDGIDGPVVVTFGRVAHKLVKDVPCFDLLNVDRVELKDPKTLSAR